MGGLRAFYLTADAAHLRRTKLAPGQCTSWRNRWKGVESRFRASLFPFGWSLAENDLPTPLRHPCNTNFGDKKRLAGALSYSMLDFLSTTALMDNAKDLSRRFLVALAEGVGTRLRTSSFPNGWSSPENDLSLAHQRTATYTATWRKFSKIVLGTKTSPDSWSHTVHIDSPWSPECNPC